MSVGFIILITGILSFYFNRGYVDFRGVVLCLISFPVMYKENKLLREVATLPQFQALFCVLCLGVLFLGLYKQKGSKK